MKKSFKNGWQIEVEDPIQGHSSKPRDRGLTMVLDKGLGLNRLKNLIAIGGRYIDFIKFSFGTSFLYSPEILREKIKSVVQYGIDVYPGGTLFEVAVSQNKLKEYLFRAKQLGFTAIEISNGTFEMSNRIRQEAIMKAKSLGFKVLTEVGKKDRDKSLTFSEMVTQLKEDIKSGVYKIIIEGRESGRGISIYNDDGTIDMKMFKGLLKVIDGREDILMWEAPLKKQQVTLIKWLGPNVNLGNIASDEVIALETLRRGLRGDTFGYVLQKEYNRKNKEDVLRA